ncbi:uncharacterized protein [Dermacentor albipictus]|uniref:uncharacterized protein isoform X2 n=1 Tax=Dermacentor albipictus TaxID=60249 RepID=UPI0038FD0970
MLTCADTPLPTLHTLAPGLLFTCHVSRRSSEARSGARNAALTPPIASVADPPRNAAKRIPRRPSTCARTSPKSAQAVAVPALSVATTSQDSAPRTPRSDAEQLLQAPAAQPGATTPFRDTTEADGERTPKQPAAVSPGGAREIGSKAGSPMRRNSPPAVPGPSGVAPHGSTPAQQPTSPADEPAAGVKGEPEDSNSLKWMSTKEPGAKVKRRDDEESSAGPSHVQLQSPAASPIAPKKRSQRLCHAAVADTRKTSGGGSRTEFCGILSGLLGRFRIKSISLGDVDEVTFWKNPGESGDWHLGFLQQLHVLGKGSFGVVYLVRHKLTKELAALKCIEKHHREQAKEARRVEAERLAWQAVSHHPYVATLKAYYETTKAWCFIMEYVPRGTLSQIIRRSGPLPESKAKVVSAQLAHALNFVHDAGYLHRDISSSNVLLDERGNARLIDFGLCQLGLEARNRCGSLAYMAPEVLRREHYGVGADWWSFGIVLYTMLIGKTPLSQYAAEQNINIQTTRRELRYSMALAAPLRFPRSLTDEAYNILQEILREDPAMRLGCRASGVPGNGGFQEMMQHKFFATIEWRALIGDVRLNPRSVSRTPREEAAASGTLPSRATRQRSLLDLRPPCWCAPDETWQARRPPRKHRARKPPSRSHQPGGDPSAAGGRPNGPATGSQRHHPAPLGLGGRSDAELESQAAGVTQRLGSRTCAAARRRRAAAEARCRDSPRRPVPQDWCGPRPLPRRALPKTSLLPETSEAEGFF